MANSINKPNFLKNIKPFSKRDQRSELEEKKNNKGKAITHGLKISSLEEKLHQLEHIHKNLLLNNAAPHKHLHMTILNAKIYHFSDKKLAMTSQLLNSTRNLIKLSKLKNGKQQDALSFVVDFPGFEYVRIEPRNSRKTVKFDQGNIISGVRTKINDLRFPRLNAVINNYNGLCEIICNYIVMNDILSPNKSLQVAFDDFKHPRVLKELENDVAPLHILKQVSIFQIMQALLSIKIPHNYLSRKEQKGLNNVLEKLKNKKEEQEVHNMISNAIARIERGSYAKFFVYNKNLKKLSFSGHSMLIRRNSDNTYTFFDPNYGAKENLTKEDLQKKLIDTFRKCNKDFGCKNMCFMNVQKMLPKPKDKITNRAKI